MRSRNRRTDAAIVAGIGAMSVVIAVWGQPWPSIAAASIAATVAALWVGRRPGRDRRDGQVRR
jgi:CHASE2 domain-containing sensor protein